MPRVLEFAFFLCYLNLVNIGIDSFHKYDLNRKIYKNKKGETLMKNYSI